MKRSPIVAAERRAFAVWLRRRAKKLRAVGQFYASTTLLDAVEALERESTELQQQRKVKPRRTR